GVEPLLSQRGPRFRGVDPLRRASHLPSRLPYGFSGLQLQTRDPLRRLTPLDIGAGEARIFVAVPDRIADGHTDAPRRIVGAERLRERRAETPVARTGNRAGKAAGAQELRAPEPAAAIRGFQTHIRESLVVQILDVGLGVLEILIGARQIVAAV